MKVRMGESLRTEGKWGRGGEHVALSESEDVGGTF